MRTAFYWATASIPTWRKSASWRLGSEKVNRLILNAKWSQKDNFVDVPTDCPQRDERMGWTGDAQVFSSTACFLHGLRRFL